MSWAAAERPSPNSKLNIAGIGIGGQGELGHRRGERRKYRGAFATWIGITLPKRSRNSRTQTYKDFREMLDKEKSIDAVVVGTPGS